MVRIAGIDKELSPLEVLFYQASDEERIELATSCLAVLTKQVGGVEFTVTMEDETVIKISTSEEKTVIETLDEIDEIIEEVEGKMPTHIPVQYSDQPQIVAVRVK